MAYDSDTGRVSFRVPKPPKLRRIGSDSPFHFTRRALLGGLAVWAAVPALFLLYKAFISVFMPGFGRTHSGLHLFLERNLWAVNGGFLGLAGTTWLLVTLLSIATIVVISTAGRKTYEDDGISFIEGGTIVLNVVLLLVSSVAWIYTTTYGDRDDAIKYNSATTIHVTDLGKMPSSMNLLITQKDAPRQTSADGKTLTFGDLATVQQGTLPTDLWTWEPRNSSLSGAQKWLDNKTPSVQGVDLWEDTLTYVYGKDDQAPERKDGNTTPWTASDENTSRWSAVMDGSGWSRAALGVAEWRGGETNVHVCRFDDKNGSGSYKFAKAFHGSGKNSLRNVIAKAYPNLFFNNQDVAGYCDKDNRPVITVSMLKNVASGSVTTEAPACLLVLKGSSSGFPSMQCLDHVQPGDFPIQVYPLSIVSKQRDAIDWAAGRGNKDVAHFGYEPSSYASQASNVADYVLRSKLTGREYAVTPSKFNKTKSQKYVLYQIEEVDRLDSGQLNHMDAYVQEDDAQAVNPAVLDTNAHIYMGWVLKQAKYTEYLPITFFGDGGSIEEYVPLTTDVFRGYGIDKTGATRFYIDISASGKTNPVVTILDIAASAPVVTIEVPGEISKIGNGETLKPSVSIICNGKDITEVSIDEFNTCMQAYLDEWKRRSNQQPSNPSPTPSNTPSPVPSPTG
jgi:hypothetical protein